MARDLLLKKTGRDWSRGTSTSCGDSRSTEIVIRAEPPHHSNVLGWAIGLSVGSRILTGKWPWYWARKLGKAAE